MCAHIYAHRDIKSISFFLIVVQVRIYPSYLYYETMKTAKKQKEEPLESGPNIARKIDLDPATIRRWVREGAPHHVIGDKLVRYRLSELLAWRAAR